jgi:hypothetical protein
MEEELRNAEEADRRKKEDERLLALTPPAQTAGTIEANSQLSAAVSETPGESPYAGEAVYPPVIPAAPEVPAEETYPRILPPSTGEPVPAAQPGSLAALTENPTARTEATSPDPEQAPHG